jgi:hypothetical protein
MRAQATYTVLSFSFVFSRCHAAAFVSEKTQAADVIENTRARDRGLTSSIIIEASMTCTCYTARACVGILHACIAAIWLEKLISYYNPPPLRFAGDYRVQMLLGTTTVHQNELIGHCVGYGSHRVCGVPLHQAASRDGISRAWDS